MAFLDNSGDIILDAVLTDAGRQRMARGEFKIVKFALSDEEVNYATYNSNHPSGSAFSDLEIMQTPVLEAFTNNTSLMKTKLISINRNNILYMPLFRVNDLRDKTKKFTGFDGFYLLADESTRTAVGTSPKEGVLDGTGHVSYNDKGRHISVEQGMDTGGEPPITADLPDDLVETAFLVRVDHRLLRLKGYNGVGYDTKSNSFVDDDAIASYYIGLEDTSVEPAGTRTFVTADGNLDANLTALEKFDGPIGTRLRIALETSTSVKQSTALFTELGTTPSSGALDLNTTAGDDITTHSYIDTVVNVVGVTTGYSIDIPVRIIKKLT